MSSNTLLIHYTVRIELLQHHHSNVELNTGKNVSVRSKTLNNTLHASRTSLVLRKEIITPKIKGYNTEAKYSHNLYTMRI
ncbi:MAG: hypothetical protein WBZ36_14575 [Candidatus Nitrosopolaris sp.]